MSLYLPVGPPGCGKSHLGQSLNTNRIVMHDGIVSTDRFRQMMTGNPTNQSANGPAWEVARTIAHQRLEHGLNVYFDATNLNPDWYDKMLAKAHEKGHRVLFILFDTSYEMCRRRNADRKELAIPDLAVEQMIELHKTITAEQLKPHGDVITGSDPAILIAGIKTWIEGLPLEPTT